MANRALAAESNIYLSKISIGETPYIAPRNRMKSGIIENFINHFWKQVDERNPVRIAVTASGQIKK